VKPFAALILAAGLSSRMGKLKALLPLGGETIIERLIASFYENRVEIYVVTGHRGQEIAEMLRDYDVTFVENPDYASGMFSSVKAGVRALRTATQAFFVMPVDIPLIKKSSVESLIDAYHQHSGKIIYPVFEGKRGHPPLLPVNLATVISNWSSDGNLRDVLNSQPGLAFEVDVNDRGVLLDIDTTEDYQSLLKSIKQE
jgi:molybdenum cofactor cytidylyltransferase